ncbi:hypothetical protein BKI52_04330 [marine bacterium AO1-C]|nr:hypothetical protein BKI52_04330 [marine bacterium AO1-C]
MQNQASSSQNQHITSKNHSSASQQPQNLIQAKQRPVQAKQKPIQAKQRPVQAKQRPIQAKQKPIQRNSQSVGSSISMPGQEAQVKTNVGNITGVDVSDAKVHYNSNKPAQIKAEAYAQGNEVHLAPGKEQHLGHELAHVVQQKQGRVQPTIQGNNGVGINNDPQLEHEADAIGAKAHQTSQTKQQPLQRKQASGNAVIQQKGRKNQNQEEDEAPIDERFTVEKYLFTSMADGKMGSIYFEGNIRIRFTHGGGPEIEDNNELYNLERLHVPREKYNDLPANITRKQKYKWAKKHAKDKKGIRRKATIKPMTEADAQGTSKYQLVEFYKAKADLQAGKKIYKKGSVVTTHPSRGIAVQQTFTQKEINAMVKAAQQSEDKKEEIWQEKPSKEEQKRELLEEVEFDMTEDFLKRNIKRARFNWQKREKKQELRELRYDQQIKKKTNRAKNKLDTAYKMNGAFYNSLESDQAATNFTQKVRRPEEVILNRISNHLEYAHYLIYENGIAPQEVGFFNMFYTKAETVHNSCIEAFKSADYQRVFALGVSCLSLIELLESAVNYFVSYKNVKARKGKDLDEYESVYKVTLNHLEQAAKALDNEM